VVVRRGKQIDEELGRRRAEARETKQAAKLLSPEERAAAKQRAREEKDRAASEERQLATPLGRATEAFEAGSAFFEIQLDAAETERKFGASAYDSLSGPTERTGHADVLGQIEAVGWHLEHMASVFVMTGQTSRDKFMSSGQDVGVYGKVINTYLFRRAG
jgi:hypothetical protein